VKNIDKRDESITQTPTVPSIPSVVPLQKVTPAKSRLVRKGALKQAQLLQEQCRQVCINVFFREDAPVSSLGFTSAISGEGKSFVALVTAGILANDSSEPVVLLDCNWEHPFLHEYFGLPSVPGLAEWVREECSESAMRYQVSDNLTIIPAGNGKQDAIKLLQQIRKKGLLDVLTSANERLIIDLPAILTTGYGQLAASLVESLMIVVCAGVTPEALIAETITRIEALPVQGLILNKLESRIPRWIRQIL